MRRLVLCTSCSRHVAISEPGCPFCGTAISEEIRSAPEAPAPPRGMSRAQIYAFKMAMLASGAAAVGCNDPKLPDGDAATTATAAQTAAAPEPTATATATAVATIATDPQPSASVVATVAAPTATAAASAPVTAKVNPPPPPKPDPTVPPRWRDDRMPPKPYGCVWADPEDDDIPV